jgi:Mg2+/Co2+ transporter CorB
MISREIPGFPLVLKAEDVDILAEIVGENYDDCNGFVKHIQSVADGSLLVKAQSANR